MNACFPTRRLGATLLLVLIALMTATGGGSSAATETTATPAATDPCAAATPVAEVDMGTPMVGMAMELDQLYIDMMIPHHASIVAMAEAALPRLQEERLREIAEGIVEAQSAEIEELRGYRERFYGSPEPMPMDDRAMGMMQQLMPGMPGSMAEMAMQMDPAAQVAAICAAGDADLAFIDLTIPHHETAIVASETARERATYDETRAFAERVVADQQREIDELSAIRRELSSATPVAAAR